MIDGAVLSDQDARKERLVEQAPLQWSAGEVGRSWRPGLGQCPVERCLDVSCLKLGGIQEALCLEFLGLKALLLAGEHLIGDEPLVGELHQPGLVVGQCFDLALVALDVLGDDRGALIGVALHVGPDPLAYRLGNVDAAVVVGDGLLDLGGRVVAAWTGPALPARAAPDAAEVLIYAAVAAVLAVEQPATTDPAVESAAQVVLILVRSISGYRPGG